MRRPLPLLLLVLLAVAGCSRERLGEPMDAAGQPQRIDCRGTVGPAVVFVHGLGDRASAASFGGVRSRLAHDRRTCRYDRPGAGDAPSPTRTGRDARDLDRELAAVVDQADPDGPVVLVGHAFGSYPVLYFAATRPDRVAGVVTLEGVDPSTGLLTASGTADWSAMPMDRESLDLPAVQRETAAAVRPGRLGSLPLLVLERDTGDPAWAEGQRRIAALSTTGQVVRVPHTGHELPTDAPDAVADAIRTIAPDPT